MPIWGWIIIIGASILLLVIIYISYLTFRFATNPRTEPRLDWTKVPRFSNYGPVVQKAFADYDAMPKEEVTIESLDHIKLKATIIEHEDAKGTMILLHGYRSSAIVDFSVMIKHCYDLGYNLVLPAQRGCAISEGKYITFGLKERYDLKLWIEYTNKLFGEDTPLILYGVSMGAATVLMEAELGYPKNVKLLISDCGFNHPWKICQNVLVTTRHLPTFPILYLCDLFFIIIAHCSLHKACPTKALAKTNLPIIYYHGRLDQFVPIKMGIDNLNHTNGPKEMYIMEKAIHGTCMLEEAERYQKTFDQFIEKYGK